MVPGEKAGRREARSAAWLYPAQRQYDPRGDDLYKSFSDPARRGDSFCGRVTTIHETHRLFDRGIVARFLLLVMLHASSRETASEYFITTTGTGFVSSLVDRFD